MFFSFCPFVVLSVTIGEPPAKISYPLIRRLGGMAWGQPPSPKARGEEQEGKPHLSLKTTPQEKGEEKG